VFAEGQAMRRIPMYMQDWIDKLNGFLTLNDRAILDHAGKVSHELAKEIAENAYDRFNANRIHEQDQLVSTFDKIASALPTRKSKTKK